MDRQILREVKFAAADKVGEFEGYASIFGNVDSHGDVVEKGAARCCRKELAKIEGLAVECGGCLEICHEISPGQTVAMTGMPHRPDHLRCYRR